jgi:hypothetical protein
LSAPGHPQLAPKRVVAAVREPIREEYGREQDGLRKGDGMADTEPAHATPMLDRDDADTAVEKAAERRLVHHVVLGALVGIPVGIVVALVIVFIGIQFADVPEGTPELMAVFVGVLFGVFFGALSGFVRNTAALDALDRHADARVAPKPAV